MSKRRYCDEGCKERAKAKGQRPVAGILNGKKVKWEELAKARALCVECCEPLHPLSEDAVTVTLNLNKVS